MNRNKFRLQKVIIALTLSWAFSLESHLVKAIEEIEPLTNLLNQGENSLTPIAELPVPVKLELTLPPKGAPGKRKGAGSRTDCPFEEFIALVPGTNFGLTTSERPTFWFYVPYSDNNKLEAKFWLHNKQGNQIYEETFRLQNTPGIVKITLPETVSPLVVEDLYRWHFSVICNGSGLLKDDFVSGGIERLSISSDLEKLEGKNRREHIAVYAQQGLWFDALTALAELRLANPQDKRLAKDWADLLQQVGLEDIESKPLVDCCATEN
ncbi:MULTISPECIES: DUF928 domain-containing protein [unclassified Moorena]|uniref:DUF928 domain-containing protein n=1 Tax=unclassified Moorena TaxID=2683338 RepID=UPI0013FFC2E4|nr:MULTISPECIES: DUF928 domain-containing protein [unclassified Moorena]NEO16151.1 DUF928 domain-containing protein [Moorena sp. SIO3E8]NEQ02680.1 DUF928 domain-containing protein [Moorena sp. SIO3F7]